MEILAIPYLVDGGGDGLWRARFQSRRREDAANEDVVREVKVRHAPALLSFSDVVKFHGKQLRTYLKYNLKPIKRTTENTCCFESSRH